MVMIGNGSGDGGGDGNDVGCGVDGMVWYDMMMICLFLDKVEDSIDISGRKILQHVLHRSDGKLFLGSPHQRLYCCTVLVHPRDQPLVVETRGHGFAHTLRGVSMGEVTVGSGHQTVFDSFLRLKVLQRGIIMTKGGRG